MKDERRRAEAIPDDAKDSLNDLQQNILLVVEKYGWSLKFVRHSDSEPPIVVIEDGDGRQIGVLEDNGAINYESGIVIRGEGKP